MNEFDQWVKHKLKAHYYIRYADDFVFFSHDKSSLQKILPEIEKFLDTQLLLYLHPDKVHIKTLASGVDFLGWVHFPNHRVLRTVTKWRMFKNLKKKEYNPWKNSCSHPSDKKTAELYTSRRIEGGGGDRFSQGDIE